MTTRTTTTMTRTLSTRNMTGEARRTWHSDRNLWMALVCWTVGLGNCWRFPVAANLDGGGAFLLPYLLETVLVAVPFTFMELGLGQFSSKGPVGVWELSPLFKGTGYASVAVIACVTLYYNVINSYLLFFLFASMSTVLPWSVCDPAWADINCYTFEENASIWLDCVRRHGLDFCRGLRWENSALHYWNVKVLSRNSDTIGALGSVRWEIACCSAVTVALCFLVNCKGTRSMERVLVFLSAFPYACLALLLFVSSVDPGSARGVRSFLTPDFAKLLTTSPWRVAFEQILFSTGLGLGGLVTLGSRCSFRNAAHAQAIALNLIDIASSVCYGVTIFNLLGALSYDLDIPVERIVQWPDTLLFAKIPLCMLYLPGVPQVWAVAFYAGLYVVGLRSQALMLATVLATLYDCRPQMLRHTALSSALCSLAVFLLGCPFVTQVGSVLIDRLDDVIVGPALLTLCLFETIGVAWVYGAARFTDDMHFMLGFRSGPYWQTFWALSPALLGLGCMHSFYRFFYAAAEDTPKWRWIFTLQCAVSFAPLVLIIVGAAVAIRRRGGFRCEPSAGWGPADPLLRKSRQMFSAHSMTKEYTYRRARLGKKMSAQDEDDSG